jgi:hypothetical protein
MTAGLDIVRPHAALRRCSPAVSRSFGNGWGWRSPLRDVREAPGQHALRDGRGNPPPSAKSAKHLVDRCFWRRWSWGCGAGGNRTPVRQPVDEPATTIPGTEAVAASPAGRSTTPSGGPRSVFPERQPSFRLSAVFPAGISRFCCRAAGERPRVAFLLTMSLRSPGYQAARANCCLAILVGAPFSESEQLGSQARPSSLTSKPVSPVD